MRKVYSILVLMLLWVLPGIAQQFPVQVTPQLLPPYSLQLSDYYSPTTAGVEKLRVMVLNRDLLKPQLSVRLRLTVESNAVRLRTREDVVYPTLTINSGVPYYITPQELAPYFNVDHLELSGISRLQYESSGKLPEGLYTFCLEIVDVVTGQTISNKGCAMAWMTLNEPPFLNLPRKAEAIIPREPQNIIFQWTPRHTASPTAAFTTDYIFSIVEILDSTLTPESAFTTYAPLYTDSITATTYLYDVTKPALLPGKRYAWRIQAKAKEGLEDLALFRNRGYSETYWFLYQNTCPMPTGITATIQGQAVAIQWQPNEQHLEYKLEYRETGNAAVVWFTATNTLPRMLLTDLKPGKAYEYRVGGACAYGSYTYSTTFSFTSNDSTVNNIVNCGDSSAIPASVTGNLLSTLNVGDTIKAGDFNVMVTQASGSGSFTGQGYVMIPWLANVKVAVKFESIGVNANHQLTIGNIKTAYDPNGGGIINVDEIINVYKGGVDVGRVVSGVDTAKHIVDFLIQWPGGINVQFGSGYNTETGSGPVTISLTPSGNGAAQNITESSLPTTIKDKGGNIYQIKKDGVAVLIGKAGGQDILAKTNKGHIDSEKAEVRFVNYPQKQIYAFDEWKEVYTKSGAFNKKYERLNDEYYVSAKAIAPGKTDYLKAIVSIKDTTLNPDSIQFVNGKGTIYSREKLSTGVYEIAVIGGPENDAQEVFALYPKAGSKTLNLGKVLVASYPEKTFKIKLVPVNGISVSPQSIQDSLNNIYGKINLRFTVSTEQSFTNTSWDLDGDGLDVKGSGALTSLTPEMKGLISAFSKSRSLDNEAFYVFVLNKAADSAVIGDMPRGQKFGFLFTDGNSQKEVTVAHEVAHGIFKLKHIFEDYGFSKSDLAGNVLNYPAGSNLTKYQWDLIFDPAFTLTFFDSDSDNELAVVNADEIPAKFKNSNSETYSFYDPLGSIVTLPATIKAVYFSTGDMYSRPNTNYVSNPNIIAMVGSLAGFVDANDSTWWHSLTTRGDNVGYLKKGTDMVYKEPASYVSISKKPIVGRPCFVNGKFKFQIVNVLYPSDVNITNRHTFQSVDHFANYFVSNYDRCEYINSYTTDLTRTAQDYVLANIKNTAPNLPYATYIFGLADLMNKFPELHNLCNTATDEGFEAYKKHIDSTVTDINEKQKNLLEYYKGYFDLYLQYHNENKASVLTLIANACELDPNSVANYFVAKPACVSVRIQALAQLKCLMYGLNWDTERKKLLDMLYEYLQNYNMFKNEASLSLADLIDKAPVEQRDQLLAYLEQSNFQKLFGAYKNLTTDLSKEQFAQAVTGHILAKYSSGKQNAIALKVEPLNIPVGSRSNTINIPLWNTSILEDCAGINDGKTCKSFTATMNEATGEMTVKFTIRNNGTTTEEWICKGNPYTTWVNLHIKEDFNYANLKSGQVLTVPLFYAYHMAKQHRSILNAQALRIGINTAAILGAVFTGGTSLSALGVVDVVASTTDIVVTVNEDKLKNTQFAKYWNDLQLLIGGVQILGSTGIGNTLRFNLSETKLASLSRAEFRNMRMAVGNLLQEAANGLGIMDGVKKAAFKLSFETQLLKYEIKKFWSSSKTLQNVSLSNNYNQLSIQLPNLSLPVKLADYRYVDNGLTHFLNEGRAGWVEDLTQLEANLASGKLRKVGELQDTRYYVATDKQGEGTLEIYQEIQSPNKLYVARKIENAVVTGTNGLLKYSEIQQSFSVIQELKNSNKLTLSVGLTTDIELAAIHRYTANGDFLNIPMRQQNGPLQLDEFSRETFIMIEGGLKKLRQTNRLYIQEVYRGRTYSLSEFNQLFNNGLSEIPLKGFVSTTKKVDIALEFISKTANNLPGEKVKCILKIKPKNGVDIDDFSDWGSNLVFQKHPGNPAQLEVLLEEGYFKLIGQPKPILVNGTPKVDPDGTPWMEIELEELLKPIR